MVKAAVKLSSLRNLQEMKGKNTLPDVRRAAKPLSLQKTYINSIPKLMLRSDEVAILLGTYNGEKFLKEQLESINNQSHDRWRLIVSDDCSTDNTLKILSHFESENVGRTSLFRMPRNMGFRKNFLALLCSPYFEAEYYAFCDQDDIWNSDKLERAINWLQTTDPRKPALYCTRTLAVDASNKEIGLSPLFTKPPRFSNALVQSLAGANTMVFNHAARELALKAGHNVRVASHDWWMYLLVSGADGQIYYDREPSLRYRQHADNFIGINNQFSDRLCRINMLLQDQFKVWNDGNIDSLYQVENILTKSNRELLNQFNQCRKSSSLERVRGIHKAGLFRQTLFGQCGLYAATIINKI